MGRRGDNIYHRKDGLWEARYVKEIDSTGKKKYGSVYSRSYKEAKEKREEVISKLITMPQTHLKQRMTLTDLVQEWLYVNQSRIKPSTFIKFNGFLKNHIKDQIGNYQIIYITPVVIRNYTNEKLKSGLCESSINSILGFIHTCLKYANRQYGTPLIEFIYLKVPYKEMRVLSVQEQTILVEYLKKDMDIYKLGVLFALYTGVRIGELCALKWADIKENAVVINKTMQRLSKANEKGTELIVLDPKTYTSVRTIPLPDCLKEYVESFRVTKPDANFLSNDQFETIEPRVMQYCFKKYIEKLGFPHASFHSLRHSFATRCVEQNVDINALSTLLGHSTIVTTAARYVHTSFEHIENQINKLTF